MNLNSEQLKSKIREMAKDKELRTQEILQMVMFERVLLRLEQSRFKENFIIKGGLLIASMIGVSSRTTQDMDITIKGIIMNEETVSEIIHEIVSLDVNDGVQFMIDSIKPIRENDAYENFRVSLYANFGKIHCPLKIDITIGDVITPSEVRYSYPKIFGEGFISILAYPLETILAEKFETIISRNIATTRARDFYDIYILFKSRRRLIDDKLLVDAIIKTSEKRNTLNTIINWKAIVDDIAIDEGLILLWQSYLQENKYIPHLEFSDAISQLYEIGRVFDSSQH